MPRLKLKRFKARHPAPDVFRHYVRAYASEDLYHRAETLPPISSATLFGADRPLVIDLGCGRGEFITAQAQERPDELFAGFEWHDKSIWDAVNRAHDARLDNVRFIRADFRRALVKVPDQSVSEAFMLFPPPVTRRNRLKNDPLPDATLREIHRVLIAGATFVLVTDSPEYFGAKRALIEDSGLFTGLETSRAFEGGLTRFQRFWEGFDIASQRLACRKA
jgi:tRNA (guanine-N7-)-methyltransferase